MIRGTLKLALILYICAALSGVYVLSASARITPHDGGDDTMLITIVKGDTLWDLCQEHLKDPLQWRELSKYNDFTNPHLIYPGEQLRIPVAMAKEVVELAEDELVEYQAELERLKVELAESEATRDKLEAEISGLNESMAELQEKLKALEDSLTQKQLIDVLAQFGQDFGQDFGQQLGESVHSMLKEVSAHLDEQLAKLSKMHEERKMEAKATHEQIESLQGDVKMLLTAIETNQKAISEVKRMLENAKGHHEELSSSKRAWVFLTTVAAGVGLFIIGSMGGRSGE